MQFENELRKIRRDCPRESHLMALEKRQVMGFQSSHENWTAGSTGRNQQILAKFQMQMKFKDLQESKTWNLFVHLGV